MDSDQEMRFIEEHPRLKRIKWIPAHKAEVQGLSVHDWRTLGSAILSLGPNIYNADDMTAVLRSIKWDARFIEPNKIQLEHMRIAMSLIQMGRVDQIERSDG